MLAPCKLPFLVWRALWPVKKLHNAPLIMKSIIRSILKFNTHGSTFLKTRSGKAPCSAAFRCKSVLKIMTTEQYYIQIWGGNPFCTAGDVLVNEKCLVIQSIMCSSYMRRVDDVNPLQHLSALMKQLLTSEVNFAFSLCFFMGLKASVAVVYSWCWIITDWPPHFTIKRDRGRSDAGLGSMKPPRLPFESLNVSLTSAESQSKIKKTKCVEEHMICGFLDSKLLEVFFLEDGLSWQQCFWQPAQKHITASQ